MSIYITPQDELHIELQSIALTCPHCRQAGDYELSWLVRTKKKRLGEEGARPKRVRYKALK